MERERLEDAIAVSRRGQPTLLKTAGNTRFPILSLPHPDRVCTLCGPGQDFLNYSSTPYPGSFFIFDKCMKSISWIYSQRNTLCPQGSYHFLFRRIFSSFGLPVLQVQTSQRLGEIPRNDAPVFRWSWLVPWLAQESIQTPVGSKKPGGFLF